MCRDNRTPNPQLLPPKRAIPRSQSPSNRCKQRILTHPRRRKPTTSAVIIKMSPRCSNQPAGSFERVCEYWNKDRRAPPPRTPRGRRDRTTDGQRLQRTVVTKPTLGSDHIRPRRTCRSHPTHPRRDVRRENLSLRRARSKMLPGKYSQRIEEARLQGFPPLENPCLRPAD